MPFEGNDNMTDSEWLNYPGGYQANMNHNPGIIEITMPEAGTSVSIWALLDTSALTNTDLGAFIYDSSDNLVDRETNFIDTIVTDQWVEVPLDGASLSNAGVYKIAMWDKTYASQMYNRDDTNINYTPYYTDWHDRYWTGTDYEDPATSGFPNWTSGLNQGLAIYLEYSTAAGGKVLLPGFKNTNKFRHMIGR